MAQWLRPAYDELRAMKIVYAGPFFFPASDANSLRVRGMIDALMLSGHEVHVVCLGEVHSDEQIDGIRVTRIPEYREGGLTWLGNGIRGLFLGDATACWLEQNDIQPDALVLYGTHSGYLLRLAKFCRRRHVKFFLDVVEWYQPSHLPGGAIGPFAISNELSMRVLARRADGIFAISRYLESHFVGLGVPVLRVPPLFKQATGIGQPYRAKDGRIHLCYAGTPGRKELLAETFAGLKDAAETGARIQMHVVGMTVEAAKANGLPVDSLGPQFTFHGRIPNKEAVKIVSACDFMLLLRPDKRFSRAGFPSKVVESLSSGTPIMANLISDLSDYLRDGENAIIIAGIDSRLVSESVRRACRLSEEALSAMRHSALATSSELEPRSYAVRIDEFISRRF